MWLFWEYGIVPSSGVMYFLGLHPQQYIPPHTPKAATIIIIYTQVCIALPEAGEQHGIQLLPLCWLPYMEVTSTDRECTGSSQVLCSCIYHAYLHPQVPRMGQETQSSSGMHCNHKHMHQDPSFMVGLSEASSVHAVRHAALH